jgi:hypothetical protein
MHLWLSYLNPVVRVHSQSQPCTERPTVNCFQHAYWLRNRAPFPSTHYFRQLPVQPQRNNNGLRVFRRLPVGDGGRLHTWTRQLR